MVTSFSRRHFLASSSAAALAFSPLLRALRAADAPAPRCPIAACDWSLGKSQDPAAFTLAKEIGLDGVQVSFDAAGTPHDLRLPASRERFLETSQKTGVQICSLAIAGLNSLPLATEDKAEKWVADCIETLPKLQQKIVLLAFFGAADIKSPAKQELLLPRLKRLAPAAEKAGVILGLETTLDAAAHLKILDAVNSPALQVYYDVCNMTDEKYDVPADLRKLKGRICQIHCKENGKLLGQGVVDFAGVKKALLDIDYRSWLVIEGATVRNKPLIECYQHNRRFLGDLMNA